MLGRNLSLKDGLLHVEHVINAMIQHPEFPEKKCDETTIYSLLITTLNDDACKGLAAKVRSALAAALMKKKEALIKTSNLEGLQLELAGLLDIQKNVALLQGKGGLMKTSDEKTAMRQIKEYITEITNAIDHIKIKNRPEEALLTAATLGNLPEVKRWVEAGVNINFQSKKLGSSVLYHAAYHGHLEVVKYLIEKKAQIDLPTNDSRTPLYVAASHGREEIVRFLVNSGAGINLTTKEGAIPLQIAAQEGYEEIVRFLANKGAEINAATNEGATALYLAAQNGRTAVVDALISLHADVNHVKKGHFSPLYTAASQGHASVVKLLIEAGADIHKKADDGMTALGIAFKKGREEVVSTFIRSLTPGLDNNRLAIGDYSPLITCINGGVYELELNNTKRKRIRLCLITCLHESMTHLFAKVHLHRLNERACERRLLDLNSMKNGLMKMKKKLEIIQSRVYDYQVKHAMFEVSELIGAVTQVITNIETLKNLRVQLDKCDASQKENIARAIELQMANLIVALYPPRAQKNTYVGSLFANRVYALQSETQHEPKRSPQASIECVPEANANFVVGSSFNLFAKPAAPPEITTTPQNETGLGFYNEL